MGSCLKGREMISSAGGAHYSSPFYARSGSFWGCTGLAKF
jgi:hypothetical protein